jgi:hypothetical protein
LGGGIVTFSSDSSVPLIDIDATPFVTVLLKRDGDVEPFTFSILFDLFVVFEVDKLPLKSF